MAEDDRFDGPASARRGGPAATGAAGWARSGYRCSPGSRVPAAAAALLLVAGLLAVLLGLDAGRTPPHRPSRLLVVALPLPTVPPPPPPSRPVQRQAVRLPVPVPIVAPPPIVAVPIAPPVVATAPAPAPPVAAPPAIVSGPPAPPAAAAAPAPAIADLGDLSSRMIFAKPPAYPLESRRRREEGVVVLDVLVSVEGVVAEIGVAETSGSALLDRAALDAVRKWRWAPLVRDGAPVMVRGHVRMPFVLKR